MSQMARMLTTTSAKSTAHDVENRLRVANTVFDASTWVSSRPEGVAFENEGML